MQLQELLAPKSVAIVGASNREGSLGFDTVRMIKNSGYRGEVYPINPKYKEILGLPVYPDLNSIGKSVDTVVLCIAARRVEDQVDIAIKAGAKSLVIFANCVLEEDTTPNLEERIMSKCKEAGIPLMGHNSMGYYNNDIDLRICGFEAPDAGEKGNIAFISQSGSAFSTIGHNEPQLKFNLMVAAGTGHITSLSDYMLHALEMDTTKVLGLYMESVRKPDKFIEALELAAEKRIPVVAMKVGKSELGAKFALSHTGGLAGDDDAIQAVFNHYGVHRAQSLDELGASLALFSFWPNDMHQGKTVAIADSGGERNLLADAAEDVGLEYAALSEETMEKLDEIQEYGQDAANPLDPWGTGIDFERIFAESMEIMLKDEAAKIGVISQDLRDGYYLSEGCVGALAYGHEKTGKPVAFVTNFGGVRRKELTKKINNIGIPVLVGTEPSLRAIKNFENQASFLYEKSNEIKEEIPEKHLSYLENLDVLKEAYALEVLRDLGLPMTESHLVTSEQEIKKLDLHYPLVLKTAVDGILHKADVKGVKVNIKTETELLDAYRDMEKRLGKECLIQPMSTFDVELILGMKDDPIFGPLMIIGAGGIFTELLRDRFIVLPKASRKEIEEGLNNLQIHKLFEGFRGSDPINKELLIDVILRFGEVIQILSPYIKEMDLNPLVIKGDKITGLDALIVTKSGENM